MWQRFRKNKIVQFLASLKLAVIVILSLTVLMIWGTFTESAYSTLYAKWRVYLSPLFIGVEVFLFINILFAALVRFPYKKRLLGFYIIHLGLLTLILGAGLTALEGIDGNLRLFPEKASQFVVIREPTLYAFYQPGKLADPIEHEVPLPQSAGVYEKKGTPYTSFLDYDIYVNQFIPFADRKISWEPQANGKQSLGVDFILANANFSQPASLNSDVAKMDETKVGPLQLKVLLAANPTCLKEALNNKRFESLYISKAACVPLTRLASKTSKGVTFKVIKDKPFQKIEVQDSGKTHTFFPQLADKPVTQTVVIQKDALERLLDLKSIRESATVIFAGTDHVVFGKENSWSLSSYTVHDKVALPWMGLGLTVTQKILNKKQKVDWFESAPRNNAQRHFAAHVTIVNRHKPRDQKTGWISDLETTEFIMQGSKRLELMAGNKIHDLPFAVTLNRFQMNTNPGTNDPASYESYVTVTSKEGEQKAKIFMNNPLKQSKYTLYQASYFELEDQKGFGSVLSVNYDPGRPMKYAGSLFLVLGSIIHFGFLRRKK